MPAVSPIMVIFAFARSSSYPPRSVIMAFGVIVMSEGIGVTGKSSTPNAAMS